MSFKNTIIEFLGGYTSDEYLDIKKAFLLRGETISNLDKQIENLISEKSDLISKFGKHYTLEMFKHFLHADLKKYYVRYNYDGQGEHRVNTILKTDSETENLYKDFVAKILWFNSETNSPNISSPDHLIYILKQKLNEFVAGKYNNELKAWGKKGEYWAKPQELYEKYVHERSAGDCDDRALFEFQCYKQALKLYHWWEDNRWRLRCIVVNILGAERHMLLAWVKEGPNDWIAIESTYFPDLFGRVWNYEMTIRNNWLYEIDYSFDEEGCYRRLSEWVKNVA